MATLYYGNGEVTIEGSGIYAIQIKYRGAVSITQTANDNFVTIANDNQIIIYPISLIGQGDLSKLFTYIGKLRISSVIASDENGEGVAIIVKRVMDYSELLYSTSETMTTKSEDLSSTYTSGGTVKKTTVNRKTINNLQTNDNTILYLEDGTEYQGKYHIHLADASAMSGAIHTGNSQDLYYKKSKYGKIIDELVPTAKRGKGRKTRTSSGGGTGGRAGGGGGY